MQIDVLLPYADADRQVQVHLPDGVSVLLPYADADRQVQAHPPDGVSAQTAYTSKDRGIVPPGMTVEVEQPQPLTELAVLMGQLDPNQRMATSLRQCLADLAKAKADAVMETLQHYLIASPGNQWSDSRTTSKAFANAQAKLYQVRRILGQLAEPPRLQYKLADKLKEVQAAWEEFHKLTCELVRRTSA